MADELRKLFEELRQNFNDDDGDVITSSDAGEPDDDDAHLEGIDDAKIIEESKKVSIFCRNCLFPYVSEQGKGGSIILKCEKCNHRDVVTDDNLQDTKPERSESLAMGGNLILNRFQKIVLDKNDLCDINLEDPGLIEDDFKTISETLPKITSIMKQTFSDMHKVTDDHRKVHNKEMIRRLTEQGQGKVVEAEDGTRTWHFSVPIHGSDETDDLVVLPSEYKLPKASVQNFRMVGRKGVQKVDKLVLNAGFSIEKLPDMPLFQKRLLNYCRMTRKYTDKQENMDKSNLVTQGSTATTAEAVSSEKIDKTVISTEKSIENTMTGTTSGHGGVLENQTNNSTNIAKELGDSHQENSSDKSVDSCGTVNSCSENTAESASQLTPNTTSELIQIRRDIYVLENLQVNTKNDENTDSGQKLDTEGAQAEISQSSNSGASGNGGCRPKVSNVLAESILNQILPELKQFSDILISAEEQRALAAFIPDDEVVHENWPSIDHIPDSISNIEANDAFNELTTSMIRRVSEAKEQRMRNLLEYIKSAGRTMTQEVDRVQGDMIKELQIAYHSKRIKADKQRKRLEEAQETLEHYREMITHYQQTGQFDKLLEIMEILRDYENLN